MKTESTQQHRKAELLEQITIPEIDDIDEQNSVYFCMSARAESILRGVFGEADDDHKSYTSWIKFRNFLLMDDSIDALRVDKDFKWGLYMVIQMIELGNDLREEAGADETHKLFGRAADLWIGEILLHDDSDHRAVLKLIESFQRLKKMASQYAMHSYNLIDLEIDLQTIERCQRIAMQAAKFRNTKQ